MSIAPFSPIARRDTHNNLQPGALGRAQSAEYSVYSGDFFERSSIRIFP